MKQKKGNPPCIKAMTWFTSQIAVLIFFFSLNAHAETLTLHQITGFLVPHSPASANAGAQQDDARAALVTARVYPNPELEVGGGSSTSIGPGALNGPNEHIVLAQALDLSYIREASRKIAEAGIHSADEAREYVGLAVLSQVRQAFYDILRRQAELQVTLDNESLLNQIRDKIRLKVVIGESPRYEQVKSEAESALKVAEAAYRLGQRGIIDYLDVQSTFRSVRNDYLGAHDRQAALIDIQRLRAIDLERL